MKQEARKFVQLIYELTKKDGFRKDYELVGQVRRSAISSMSNIAGAAIEVHKELGSGT